MKSIQNRPFKAPNVGEQATVTPPPVEKIKRIDKSPLHSSKGKSAEVAFLPIAVKIETTYQRWTWHVSNRGRAIMSQPRPRRGSKKTLIRLAADPDSGNVCSGITRASGGDMTAGTDTETSAEIFELRSPAKHASQGDLLRYVARTRRQLDRFEELPDGHSRRIAPDAAARIRVMCDELEADIIKGLSTD
jgi:hypothetical protein